MWTPFEFKIKTTRNDWREPDRTANQKRALVVGVCGTWMKDHGMRLGRDYTTEFFAGYNQPDTLIIRIRDPNDAMLFKLTWGGK